MVLQESYLGPILWLDLINSLLKWLDIDEVWTILIFSDDIVILARSPTVYRFVIVDIVRKVLAEIYA